jgi:hypothetical protein
MMKGAFIELVPAMNAVLPNVIVFQFNPETLRHSWSQAPGAPAQSGQPGTNALAVPGVPSETFSFSLLLDVTDQLADPTSSAADDAKRFGIYTRLSALELLVYPTIVHDLVNGLGGPSSPVSKRPTPSAVLPTVLFVWGPGRILPVRVTSLTVTEKLYDVNLNPTHAEAQIELRVLTPEEAKLLEGQAGHTASRAYLHSLGFRLVRAAAAANLGSDVGRLIGMLQNASSPRDQSVLPR